MIVITTPTGQIARQVLDNLLDGDGDEAIRVIARDPSRLEPHVRERVEVVQGSHGDPEVVDQAFAGADSVFWLAPPNRTAQSLDAIYSDFARPACDAFKRHEVGRVVGISAVGRGVTDKAGLVTATLAMDDLIASTGVAYRALTMPGFMENLLRQLDPIKNRGTFFDTVPANHKAPTCAVRDIAATAADLLRDRDWTGYGAVPILGPEDLSPDEMAHIMSEVLQRPIRYQQTPLEAFRATLVQSGMSAPLVDGMVEMMAAKNEGLDTAEPRTPQSSTPTTFRQWCEEVLKPALAPQS
jgi:uncharacterized protein YbjT (DUF2867 family)